LIAARVIATPVRTARTTGTSRLVAPSAAAAERPAIQRPSAASTTRFPNRSLSNGLRRRRKWQLCAVAAPRVRRKPRFDVPLGSVVTLQACMYTGPSAPSVAQMTARQPTLHPSHFRRSTHGARNASRFAITPARSFVASCLIQEKLEVRPRFDINALSVPTGTDALLVLQIDNGGPPFQEVTAMVGNFMFDNHGDHQFT
jgi:hypothetical protein